jgi:hypothetical protein
MPANKIQARIDEALSILKDLGLPRPQLNERSALSLLALVDLPPNESWVSASSPLVGITPIMDWIRANYGKSYAPNTRETIRRQTMHQFIQAGMALYNPDQPDRAVNSPHAVYQIESECLKVLQSFGAKEYRKNLAAYVSHQGTLAAKYAKPRMMTMIPITVTGGKKVLLSPGAHSDLIRSIWEEFGARFVPGGKLIYAGDTGEKWGYFDKEALADLGVTIDNHGKMPDVIIYFPEKNWLILAEAVTSHGPVDSKRHTELSQLFKDSTAGLVYVSAFPDRRTFSHYQESISWETEVWVADNPSHLVHFNGTRFLGPHS